MAASLSEMGFEEGAALLALEERGGELCDAVDFLLDASAVDAARKEQAGHLAVAAQAVPAPPGGDDWWLRAAPRERLLLRLEDERRVPLRPNQLAELEKMLRGDAYDTAWLVAFQGSDVFFQTDVGRGTMSGRLLCVEMDETVPLQSAGTASAAPPIAPAAVGVHGTVDGLGGGRRRSGAGRRTPATAVPAGRYEVSEDGHWCELVHRTAINQLEKLRTTLTPSVLYTIRGQRYSATRAAAASADEFTETDLATGEQRAVRFVAKDDEALTKAAVTPPPSTAPVAAAECGICLDSFDGPPFVPAGCTHGCCTGCAVRSIRGALGDAAAKVKPEGVACLQVHSGCEAFITARDVRNLHCRLASAADAAETLTGDECDRFDRFVALKSIEMALPANRRAYCPQCSLVVEIGDPDDEDATLECECGAEWSLREQRRLARVVASSEGGGDGDDAASARLIAATTKQCPNCGVGTSHYHGHACHHIGYHGNGCSNCGQHWCYVCQRPHGAPYQYERNPACPHGSNDCSSSDIARHVVQTPYPHDQRCGCPICPDCRQGRPCELCEGDCVVCRGLVPPGPKEMVAATAA